MDARPRAGQYMGVSIHCDSITREEAGMQRMSKSRLVSNFLAALLSVVFSSSLFAADAGTIEKLTGKVKITTADNIVRVAGARERIQAGETIVTDAKSETMVKMADDTTVLVRPNTQFQLTEFKYDKAQSDSSVMTLVRGTLRMVTGLIGKR